MYDLGDTLPFSAKLYDKPPESGGILVNATTVALTITLPDLTTVSATVVNPPASTGVYTYDYITTNQPGRYLGRWLFTMATGKTTAYVEVFDVRAADPGYVINLNDAKAHLNIAGNSDDEELRGYLEAITHLVENRVGNVVVTTYTERVPQNWPQNWYLWLRHTPVVSITSVTPWLTMGSTYNPTDLKIEPESGRVELKSGGPFYGGPFSVVYSAGRTIMPATITLAGKMILRHLWESQRGGFVSLGATEEMTPIPGFGFALPNRALELLQPHSTTVGFA